MTNALILFSHGSTLCGGGKNLFAQARRLEARGVAPIVEVGFLNYSDPPFEAAFERCVERGATRVIVVPYFLVAGFFVKVSLPPKIEAMKRQFAGVEVVVADAIRRDELLVEAILGCSERVREPARWRETLAQARAFCRNSPACPLYDAATCPTLSRAAIRLEAGQLAPEEDSPSLPLDRPLSPEVQRQVDLLSASSLSARDRLTELLRDRRFDGARFKTKVAHAIGMIDFHESETGVAIVLDEGNHSAFDLDRDRALAPLYLSAVAVETDLEGVAARIARARLRRALLVMVHGSPRPESNGDMFAVVEMVRATGLFAPVEVGFMECNEPSIPDAIETCVAAGAREVIAVPYFLHTGTHVADDLPGLLEEAQQRHPGVRFLMGDFLGHDPLMDEVLLKRAQEVM